MWTYLLAENCLHVLQKIVQREFQHNAGHGPTGRRVPPVNQK